MATLGEQTSGLVIGANQSVRRNAADTAFEAFTPYTEMTVGDDIVGGGANRVLFEDAAQKLETHPDFTFENDVLAVPGLKLTNTISSAAVTSAALSTNQNNYAPGAGALFVRLNATSAIDLTGLVFPTNADGELHFLANIGTANITVKNNSASSTSANRFLLAADVVILPEQVVAVVYDSASTRWRALVN